METLRSIFESIRGALSDPMLSWTLASGLTFYLYFQGLAYGIADQRYINRHVTETDTDPRLLARAKYGIPLGLTVIGAASSLLLNPIFLLPYAVGGATYAIGRLTTCD